MSSRAGLRQAEASILPSVSWVAKGQQPLKTGWSHMGILHTASLRQWLAVDRTWACLLQVRSGDTWGSGWGRRAPPSLMSCRCPVSKDACEQRRPLRQALNRQVMERREEGRDTMLVLRTGTSAGWCGGGIAPHQIPRLTDGESSSIGTCLLKVEQGAPRPLARAPSLRLCL